MGKEVFLLLIYLSQLVCVIRIGGNESPVGGIFEESGEL